MITFIVNVLKIRSISESKKLLVHDSLIKPMIS